MEITLREEYEIKGFIILTDPRGERHTMPCQGPLERSSQGVNSTEQMGVEEGKVRTCGQVALLGVRMESRNQRQKGISLVWLNVIRFHSGVGRKGPFWKGTALSVTLVYLDNQAGCS